MQNLRQELVIFADIIHNANFAPGACQSRLYLTFSAPVACYFRLYLTIVSLVAARHFCLDLAILASPFRYVLVVPELFFFQ